MSRGLYRVLNPLVSRLLVSPLHRLLSGNTLLLHYRGRRSGRELTTPVSYHLDDGVAHCFADRHHHWWRNLAPTQPIEVTLGGRRRAATAEVYTEGDVASRRALEAFLTAVPRDARHAGVRLDPRGRPRAEDVAGAVPRLVHVLIRVDA